MFAKSFLLAAVVLASAPPAVAQTTPDEPPAPAPLPPAAETFPPGAEVLSVDGEPLGRLTEVETRPGGERILHIRRTDGSMTMAPAVVASRGERAVVLEWTRAEFESAATTAAATPVGPVPAPPLL